jgi:hypothetical protein
MKSLLSQSVRTVKASTNFTGLVQAKRPRCALWGESKARTLRLHKREASFLRLEKRIQFADSDPQTLKHYRMKCTHPLLTRAAVCIVVGLALANAVNYYRTVDKKYRDSQDPATAYIIGIGPKRFRKVIAMVPPEAVLGYISDLPEKGAGAVWFAGARHTLAPRLLIPHQNPQKQDWILGNFSKSVDLHHIERQNQLELVQDFGSGVAVFATLCTDVAELPVPRVLRTENTGSTLRRQLQR